MPIIKMKKKEAAFTLIELLMVIVIIAILAAISLPNYTKAKESALGKEAKSNLSLIAAAEKIYKMEEGSYTACLCSTTAICNASGGCNSLLRLDLKPENWIYGVSFLVPGGDIQAFADRQGSGGYYNCIYSYFSSTDSITGNVACP